MFAAEWGVGQVFLAMLWFFLFIIWIWLVIAVFVDVFGSPDLSGWAKALWVLFVVATPFLGVLVYLIVRGSRMQLLTVRFALPVQGGPAERRDALTREQVEGLAHLAEQRDQGLITAAEYVEQREDLIA